MDRTPRRDLSPEEFKAIYSRVPRLSVELLLRTPEGLLLTMRNIEPRKGEWHFPGGTVFFKETAEDAVHRVAREELGVEVAIDELLGYVEYSGMLADGYFGWPVGLAFAVHITGGTPSGAEQGEEIGYFTSVPDNTVPDQARWLNEHYFSKP